MFFVSSGADWLVPVSASLPRRLCDIEHTRPLSEQPPNTAFAVNRSSATVRVWLSLSQFAESRKNSSLAGLIQ